MLYAFHTWRKSERLATVQYVYLLAASISLAVMRAQAYVFDSPPPPLNDHGRDLLAGERSICGYILLQLSFCIIFRRLNHAFT